MTTSSHDPQSCVNNAQRVTLTPTEREAISMEAAGALSTSSPAALLHLALGCGDDEPIAGLFDTIAAHLACFRRAAPTGAEDAVLAHLETLAKIGSRLARMSEKGEAR